MSGGAIISPCGRYRYRLTRGEGRRLAFVMLNPSTADASQDDPTIRRCLAFAKREGYDGIDVANVYAWRATDPRELFAAGNPFGDNDRHLICTALLHDVVVCAWGANVFPSHAEHTRKILSESRNGHRPRLVCLGTTKNGSPRHPLYVRGDTPLIDWPSAGAAEGGA